MKPVLASLGSSQPAGGSSLEPYGLYAEYVRGLDDLPVLDDVVHAPPGAPRPPEFRRGESPAVRNPPRPDCAQLREAIGAELAALYAEYCGVRPIVAPPRAKLSKRAAKRRKVRASRESARRNGVRSIQ
jgi:hypothetical protein